MSLNFMKNLLSKFEKKSLQVLSKKDLKEVKGGATFYYSCRGGMMGQTDHYESWMCASAGGLAWIDAYMN